LTVRTITWSHVPPGTQLEVSVVPTFGSCISSGDIFMQDKGLLPVKQWADGDLQPGPAVEQLKAGIDTTIDIRVVPSGNDQVVGEITATLRDVVNGNPLDTQSRKFDPMPRTHDLVRIFADADPITSPAGVAAPPGRPREPRTSAVTPRKKRGK
jgi:hypothetical protein